MKNKDFLKENQHVLKIELASLKTVNQSVVDLFEFPLNLGCEKKKT